jgi:hypothetical protein
MAETAAMIELSIGGRRSFSLDTNARGSLLGERDTNQVPERSVKNLCRFFIIGKKARLIGAQSKPR